jgi:hypothetical protein
MKKKLKRLLFGEIARGEKILPPVLPPERKINTKEFYSWCRKFRVSSQYDKEHLI